MMITATSRSAATPCSCGDTSCCDTGPLERPRFFPRQVVTATELTLEHDYQRNRARRHNRMLHGWGVVCGAEVCPTIAVVDGKRQVVPWKVTIQPGFVLGPCGDEILIDCEREVDLRTTGLTCMTGMPPGEVSDPWCSDVRIERAGEACIAIRYREFLSRPVQVHPVGCGCGADDCEYSRWRDGYEIQLLPECPDDRPERSRLTNKQQAAMVAGDDRPMITGTETPSLAKRLGHGLANWGAEFRAMDLTVDFRHEIFACPPCPEDDLVVLACVEWTSTGVVTVCGCDCRRYLVSLSPYAVCHEPKAARTIVDDHTGKEVYIAEPDVTPAAPPPAPSVPSAPAEIVRPANRAPLRPAPASGPRPATRSGIRADTGAPPSAPAAPSPPTPATPATPAMGSTGGAAGAPASTSRTSSSGPAARRRSTSGGSTGGRSTSSGSTGNRGGTTRRNTGGGASGAGGATRQRPRGNNP